MVNMLHMRVYVLLLCFVSVRADDFTSTRDIEVAIRKESYLNRNGFVTPERVENDGVQYWMSDLFYEPEEGKTLTCRLYPKKGSPLYGLVVGANVDGVGMGKGRGKGKGKGRGESKGRRGYAPKCLHSHKGKGCSAMHFKTAHKTGGPTTKGKSKGSYYSPGRRWGHDLDDFIAVCTTFHNTVEQHCFGRYTRNESLYFRIPGQWVDREFYNRLVDVGEESNSKGSSRNHGGYKSKSYNSKEDVDPFENDGNGGRAFLISDDPDYELERYIFGRGSPSEATYYRSKGRWISRDRYIRRTGMSEDDLEQTNGVAMQQWNLRGNDHLCQRMAAEGRLLDVVVTFGCDGATERCCGLRCCPRDGAKNSDEFFSDGTSDEKPDVCRSELLSLEKQKLRREIELLEEKKQLVQLEKRKLGE